MSHHPPIGVPAVLGFQGHDDLERAEFLPLIRAYVETLPDLLGSLASALARGDHAALAAGACRIRGNAALYGFDSLGEAAGALEDAIRGGADRTLVAARFEAFARLVGRVILGMQDLPADRLGLSA